MAGAINDYTASIRLKPDYAAAYGGRSYAYYLKRDYRAAVLDADKAISLEPQYARVYRFKRMALMQLNQAIEALASFEQAIGQASDEA